MKSLCLLMLLAVESLQALPATQNHLSQSIVRETLFQQILNLTSPDLVVRDKVEALLTTRYQVRGYADQFRFEIHQLAKRSEQEPNLRVNPTTLISYQRLRRTDSIGHDQSDEIFYFYSRFIETMKDEQASANVKLKAMMALNQLDQNFVELPWEDQLQIAELLNELRGLRMIQSSNFNQVNQSVLIPQIDESSPSFSRNVQLTKTIVKAKSAKAMQIAARAQAKLKAKLPGEISFQSEMVGAPTNITPSSGNEGNVTGFHFPEGIVAMTFDDGPDPRFTRPLMDLLSSYSDRINTNAAGSFFWLAERVVTYPKIVQEAIERKFSTNCHSWSHKKVERLSGQSFVHEIVDAVNVEQKIYNRPSDQPIRFYRCPGGGCVNSKNVEGMRRVRAQLASMNLVHAYWSIDSLDYSFQDTDTIVTNVIEQLKISKRGIILMHDIHPFSVEAAGRILEWIKEQNNSGKMAIRLYTIEDAVDLENQAAQKITTSTLESKKVIK